MVIYLELLTAYHTDIGIEKATNQDALLIKTAKTNIGEIALLAVCDGMGGLSSGELASATVIQAISDWFENNLPEILAESDDVESDIIASITNHLQVLNKKILMYGHNHHIQLGTTLTALLLINSNYFTIQIGDSRAYIIENQLMQITEDQSFIAREVRRGNISEEQARTHPERSVLLQCIGASNEIDVVVTSGEVITGNVILLCTDGFYHEITESEIVEELHSSNLSTEAQMEGSIKELIERVKNRHEVDNISVVLAQVL